MKTYKITVNTYGERTVKWFSGKSDAKRYAKSQVALGYYPFIELVSEDYKSSKTAHFPSVDLKAFFSGMRF